MDFGEFCFCKGCNVQPTVFVITALVTWGNIIVNQVVAGGRERSVNIQTKLFIRKHIVAGVTTGTVKG